MLPHRCFTIQYVLKSYIYVRENIIYVRKQIAYVQKSPIYVQNHTIEKNRLHTPPSKNNKKPQESFPP